MMELSVLRVLAALVLLVAPAYVLFLFDARQLRTVGVGLLRLVAQTSLVGLVAWGLYRADNPWLSLLAWLLYGGVVGWLVQRRSGVRAGVLLVPAVAGVLVASLAVGGWVLWTLPGTVAARWAVPVMAVLLTHLLGSGVRSVSTYFGCLHTDGQRYHTAVGNGAGHLQAVAPYVRRALQALVSPAVAGWSAVGVATVPWLLSGQLLGGAAVWQAVVVSVVLFVACWSASVVSLVVTVWAADARVFDRQGRIRQDLMQQEK